MASSYARTDRNRAGIRRPQSGSPDPGGRTTVKDRRILLDHSVPAPVGRYLKVHAVKEAIELGWDQLANGDLLTQAEQTGFELFITADKNLRYQQNLTGRKISLLVSGNAQWPILRRHLDRVILAVNAAAESSFAEIEITPTLCCSPQYVHGWTCLHSTPARLLREWLRESCPPKAISKRDIVVPTSCIPAVGIVPGAFPARRLTQIQPAKKIFGCHKKQLR